MRLFRVLGPLIAVLAVAGVAAGCGDDGGEAPAPPTTAAEQAKEPGGGKAPGALTVDLLEFEFEPRDVAVGRGGTITSKNVGDIVHNFTIEEGPDPNEPSKELAATPDLDPGDSADLRIDLPRGEYALVCTIPGHREAGMVGSFTVK